jgi:hypothetical protein
MTADRGKYEWDRGNLELSPEVWASIFGGGDDLPLDPRTPTPLIWLRRIFCAVMGHAWGYYRYPDGDDMLCGPHERRYCRRCHADEAAA